MGSLSFTNVCGSAIGISYLKINDTILIEKSKPSEYPEVKNKILEIPDKNSTIFSYDNKSWNDFSRIWLSIEVGGDTYSIDLNRDHYFYGGDYRYPGEGSAIVYIFSGFSEDNSMVQLSQGYAKAGDNNMFYSNDLKYLNKTAAT
ncbi:hypothetical protein [Azospirillum humicireducens]|uniref:hypothetical protein n=1 Tax=Azospirillum humicireducens TaxID=1226968 RepID=UPI000AFC34F1|nr:hypothetical protein [Azospirillum humicireducens]